MTTLAASTLKGPHIDWAGLSPLVALVGGGCIVLLVGLFGARSIRTMVVPGLTIVALGAALGLSIWQWGEEKSIVAGALRVDEFAMYLNFLFCIAGIAAVLLSIRALAPEEAGHGEYHALLLSSIAGMLVLVEAQNLVTLFLGLELLSIPLYVLCATELRRATSLESGLKYLVIGSVGSATLLYGLAFVYGATGSTDFSGIAQAIEEQDLLGDPLLLTGLGISLVGFAFKASAAPFHQWTPDVYEGAPTPVTAFMAVATKAAAFGVLIRFLDVALADAQLDWSPAVAAIAVVSVIVGNVGALTQSSLKRMLAYSSVAQAGYLLIGVTVGTKLGVQATLFYLAVYLIMNLAAFAVIVVRERETTLGDDIASIEGLGATRPWLAWPMTLAMLSLAGIPGTAGFIGKVYLIDASVAGDYAWLAIVLVVGSMISLGYYLRVIAAMWMRDQPAGALRPAIAGGSPEADAEPDVAPQGSFHVEAAFVAVLFGAATLFFGIIPSPLFDLAKDAGSVLGLL